MQLNELLSGVVVLMRPQEEIEITSIAFDSRKVEKGSLFCCIPGTKTDGHDYAKMAMERGAAALVVQRPMDLEIPQAMVADTGAYDVLLMGLSYMPVERLIEKGYCADLSQSADIMEKVSAMYPEVVEPLMVDGKLYGVPVGMSGTCYGVNMELWESLGLTEDDLPTSLPELYD